MDRSMSSSVTVTMKSQKAKVEMLAFLTAPGSCKSHGGSGHEQITGFTFTKG
jgi:hypothetical protein